MLGHADGCSLVEYVDGLLHHEGDFGEAAVTRCGRPVDPAEGWVRVDELWLRHLNLGTVAYCLRCFPAGQPGEVRPIDAAD